MELRLGIRADANHVMRDIPAIDLRSRNAAGKLLDEKIRNGRNVDSTRITMPCQLSLTDAAKNASSNEICREGIARGDAVEICGRNDAGENVSRRRGSSWQRTGRIY